jgi:hypothetical protein
VTDLALGGSGSEDRCLRNNYALCTADLVNDMGFEPHGLLITNRGKIS